MLLVLPGGFLYLVSSIDNVKIEISNVGANVFFAPTRLILAQLFFRPPSIYLPSTLLM